MTKEGATSSVEAALEQFGARRRRRLQRGRVPRPPARPVPARRRELRGDRPHEPDVRLVDGQRGAPAHARRRLGPHRHDRLGRRQALGRRRGVHDGQARAGRPDQAIGRRGRAARHHGELPLPGLDQHVAARLRRHRPPQRHDGRGGARARLRRVAPAPRARARASWRAWRCCWPRRTAGASPARSSASTAATRSDPRSPRPTRRGHAGVVGGPPASADSPAIRRGPVAPLEGPRGHVRVPEADPQDQPARAPDGLDPGAHGRGPGDQARRGAAAVRGAGGPVRLPGHLQVPPHVRQQRASPSATATTSAASPTRP